MEPVAWLYPRNWGVNITSIEYKYPDFVLISYIHKAINYPNSISTLSIILIFLQNHLYRYMI